MGARVVEGTGLENRHTSNRIVGSNPTPSAIYLPTVLPTLLNNIIITNTYMLYNTIENRCTLAGTVGSNPTLSAIYQLLSYH